MLVHVIKTITHFCIILIGLKMSAWWSKHVAWYNNYHLANKMCRWKCQQFSSSSIFHWSMVSADTASTLSIWPCDVFLLQGLRVWDWHRGIREGGSEPSRIGFWCQTINRQCVHLQPGDRAGAGARQGTVSPRHAGGWCLWQQGWLFHSPFLIPVASPPTAISAAAVPFWIYHCRLLHWWVHAIKLHGE